MESIVYTLLLWDEGKELRRKKGGKRDDPFRLIRKDRAEIQNLRLYTPLRIARLEGEDTEGAFSVRGMDFRLFENGSTDRSSFQPSSLRKNSDIMATGMNGSTILVSSNFYLHTWSRFEFVCVRGWNGKGGVRMEILPSSTKRGFVSSFRLGRSKRLFVSCHVKGCIVGKKEFFIIIISLLSKFYKFENKSRVERCSNFIIEKVSFFRLRWSKFRNFRNEKSID